MPELPEVLMVVQGLTNNGIIGRRITQTTVTWPRSAGGSAEVFSSAVTARTIQAVRRHGKYIFIDLDSAGSLDPGGTIAVHLRMSGRLYAAPADLPLTGYERVVLSLDDHRDVRFYDPRKFGRMVFYRDSSAITDRLGVDPLNDDFTPSVLAGLLGGRKRQIKALLLDQSVIAGLGNIYTDEALWRAGIHPLQRSNTLTAGKVDSLHRAIRSVLLQGIANGGTRLGGGKGNFIVPGTTSTPRNQNHLAVFGRLGEACPKCGNDIRRIVVAQRSTHLCPVCQVPAGEIQNLSATQ
jgi:formamidopyrimidine-DNA glycosylase